MFFICCDAAKGAAALVASRRAVTKRWERTARLADWSRRAEPRIQGPPSPESCAKAHTDREVYSIRQIGHSPPHKSNIDIKTHEVNNKHLGVGGLSVSLLVRGDVDRFGCTFKYNVGRSWAHFATLGRS